MAEPEVSWAWKAADEDFLGFWMGGEDEETGKRHEGKGLGEGLYNQSSAVYNSELLYKNRKTSS